ncbi:MAG TPA: hypothetical protein DDY68_03985, partial [Porphyromonadaceae bacterium]|nr:hypothetical protein [Porphyromonadaceae bacterium]
NERKEGIEEGLAEGMKIGKEEGIVEGMKIGEKKGIQKGIERGKKEGMKEGKRENSLLIAQKMKKDGLPMEVIMKYTNLSKEDIEKLF